FSIAGDGFIGITQFKIRIPDQGISLRLNQVIIRREIFQMSQGFLKVLLRKVDRTQVEMGQIGGIRSWIIFRNLQKSFVDPVTVQGKVDTVLLKEIDSLKHLSLCLFILILVVDLEEKNSADQDYCS